MKHCTRTRVCLSLSVALLPERGPKVFCSPARVVLWGENERRGTGLVPCQLCHRNHQPHCHRKQRAAHEAPAQRDQRLKQRPPSLRGWWVERSGSTNTRRTTTGCGSAAVEHLFCFESLLLCTLSYFKRQPPGTDRLGHIHGG